LAQCYRVVSAVILAASLLPAIAPVSAAALDAPTLVFGQSGTNKQPITVIAGPSGAPGGFTIWWTREQDFIANGSAWFPPGDPRQGEAHFWGEPTLNLFSGESATFRLAASSAVTVEIGDVADESGVTSTSIDELESATTYVYAAFANASEEFDQSPVGENHASNTAVAVASCIHTQGFWKNHPGNWPVTELFLGDVLYDQAQLLDIFDEPVAGNGLISLAHQLIAAKLNIWSGGDAEAVIDAVLDADALIGSLVVPPIGAGYLHPSATSGLTQILDDWNNQRIGSGSCDTENCCREADLACFPVEIGRCEELGGIVIDGECDPHHHCAPPAVEFCCLPDSTCVEVPMGTCDAQGGFVVADCDSCFPPVEMEHCCFEDGSCFDVPVGTCGGQGGIVIGDCEQCISTPVRPTTWGRIKSTYGLRPKTENR
jgi:hypothetical protein